MTMLTPLDVLFLSVTSLSFFASSVQSENIDNGRWDTWNTSQTVSGLRMQSVKMLQSIDPAQPPPEDRSQRDMGVQTQRTLSIGPNKESIMAEDNDGKLRKASSGSKENEKASPAGGPRWRLQADYQPQAQVVPLSETPAQGEAEPTSLRHVLFNVGSSTSMWKSRQSIIRTWWLPNVTRGLVWMDKPDKGPQRRTGDVSKGGSDVSLPAPVISSDTSHLVYKGRGRRDYIRHARMALDAFRLQLPHVRWYVVLDDDTFMSPWALVSLLSTPDHLTPTYVGGVSETNIQLRYHTHRMAYGGGGYALSAALVKILNSSLDDCLSRHEEFWGSDERVAACVLEAGVSLTLAPGMHQCDLRGNIDGLLQAHPPHPFISIHHFQLLDPLFLSAGVTDRVASLDRLASLLAPDPVGFLQQSVCHVLPSLTCRSCYGQDR